MKIPPPLIWTDKFKESAERATGKEMSLFIAKTVNPLVYTITLEVAEPLSSNEFTGLWNMFQIWASKNDCVPYGKVGRSHNALRSDLIVKRRNGPDKEEVP